jgi:type VI secretion system ImpC/EvpB family protein
MTSDDPNVQFSTGAEGLEPAASRPYPIVFVADLQSGSRLAGLEVVDKEELPRVLSRARPRLPMALTPPVGDGPDWEFELCFDNLRSFEPAGFLTQIPQGSWRLGLRQKVLARQQGTVSQEELESALSAAAIGDTSLAWVKQPVEAAPSGGIGGAAPEGGGSILDLVDAPSQAARISAEVERLAAAAGDPSARIPAGEAARLNATLRRLNLELGRIAEAVLRHPGFRSLEGAWRGLRFLVDRMDFRAGGVRLLVLDAPREQLIDRIVDRVINPAFEGEIPTPGMLVVDHAFGNTPVDIDSLDELAQHAAELPVPLVYPVDVQFFNIKSLRLLKNLPNLPGLVESFQFAKWKALRDKRYARALVPVVGRFILRAPYEERAGADFSFRESVGAIGDLLWGGGHLAMAVCAARAYALHGWPTRMFGAQAGRLENLPVVPNPNEPGTNWGPGDLSLPDRRLDELPEIGINLLLSVPNQDYCILLGGVSAARPIRTAETSMQQATLEISLPYQQFTNIASAFACEMIPSLRGLDGVEIQKRLLFGFRDLMRLGEGDEEAIQVGVGSSPELPGRTIVQLRLTPPGRIVPGGLHVEFGFAV